MDRAVTWKVMAVLKKICVKKLLNAVPQVFYDLLVLNELHNHLAELIGR